jgi:uncharacterized SAM-binding protein YcdF (DUF218 family)
MNQIYDVLKSFVDPIFIIFILLLIALIIWLMSGKKKGGALFLLLAVVLLYGFSIQPVSNFLSYKLEKNYISARPAEDKTTLDVIVVLGGGLYGIRGWNKTFPSETTTVRLVHAVKMYKDHNARYLVCSGKGSHKISEAELMAQMAGDFGVPGAGIRIEAKSENTYQHAVEFNKMFPDKSIRIGLVTSASHMKRSEAEFRKFFSNIQPMPACYLYATPSGTPAVRYIPQSQWLLNNTLVLREHLGRLWYGLKDL